MDSTRIQLFLLVVMPLFFMTLSSADAAPGNSKLFREYIGAEDKGVTFSDVPIDPRVEFHFILSFAIDYTPISHAKPTDSRFNFTTPSHPKPTNGKFNVFWDTKNLSPSHVSAIKASHPNAKVAVSLGGDTVKGKQSAYFSPTSINSWVKNAISSIVQIVKEYKLDGIDIDYEHFQTDPNTFAECIGQLLSHLKHNNVVSFTSIAPYDNDSLRPYYFTLWRKYGHLIDYVNFQFYAYNKGTTITQFMKHFETQSSNYKGGKVLVSFGTDNSGGLSPRNGFFEACGRLRSQGKLHGIFIWSADDSKKADFRYEKKSQEFLVS
ncbi:chitinase 2-like [Argentina anserina]|uniref:chitinase 2-like n=1 Tax=Argentina anserina TaxID=57926 RepID=UPI00217632D7|nr:chitinase 2-like [Potentilla anserina]